MWEFKRQALQNGTPLNLYHVFQPPGSDFPIGVFVLIEPSDTIDDFMMYTADDIAAPDVALDELYRNGRKRRQQERQ